MECLGSVTAVACTGVAHEYCLLLNHMAALSIGGTGIDRVLVVEAPAH